MSPASSPAPSSAFRFSLFNILTLVALSAVTLMALHNYGWKWMSAAVFVSLAGLMFARVSELRFLIQDQKVFSANPAVDSPDPRAVWVCIRIVGILMMLFGLAFDSEHFNSRFDPDVLSDSLWSREISSMATIGAFAIGLVLTVMPTTQFRFGAAKAPTLFSRVLQIAVGISLLALALAALLLKTNYEASNFSLLMAAIQGIEYGRLQINTDPIAYHNTKEAVQPAFQGALYGIVSLLVATVGVFVARSDSRSMRWAGVVTYLVGLAVAVYLLLTTPWQACLAKVSPVLGEFHVVPESAPVVVILIASALLSIPLAYWLNRDAVTKPLAPDLLATSEPGWWFSLPLLVVIFMELDFVYYFLPLEKESLNFFNAGAEWYGENSILHWMQFHYSLEILAGISILWLLKSMWNRAHLKQLQSQDRTAKTSESEPASETEPASASGWKQRMSQAIRGRFVWQYILCACLLALGGVWWLNYRSAVYHGDDGQAAQLCAVIMLVLAATIWSWNRNDRVCTTYTISMRKLAWTAAGLFPILALSGYFFQWYGAASAWADDGRDSGSVLNWIYQIQNLLAW